jgi:DNA-binding NarL/FixJ family response regulator
MFDFGHDRVRVSFMSSPPDATFPAQAARSVKILIVEDHAATRDAMRLLLTGALGERTVEIRIAESGEAAVALVEAEAPDLVIMDIALPGMNGIDATRLIRKIAPFADVVMHSNSDMDIYREMSAAAGARVFVSKRHTGRELVPAIVQLIDQPA